MTVLPTSGSEGVVRRNGNGAARSEAEEARAARTDGLAGSGAEFEGLVRRMLELLGEDPDREGLRDTPARVRKSLEWLTRGYRMSARKAIGSALFEERHGSMVLVRDIAVHSLCEHHMLPFSGRAHVAYIPAGRVVGLSKLARVIDVYARRLQVQERLTEEVAGALHEVLRPRAVGVVVEATHHCMAMRGVEKQGALTVTTALRGTFARDATARSEFLALVTRGFAAAGGA